MLYGLDTWYLVLVIPALLLSLGAQALVKGTFSKYSQIGARGGFSGQAAARRILNQNGLTGIPIERTSGQLTDHYDPRGQVLRLSESTYDSTSIAAIGVAAHEAGHAIQHDEGYLPNRLRGLLTPVAQIGSSFGPYLAIFGILLSIPILTSVGIFLYAGAVLFYLITLPVEFNASHRAIRVLEDQGLLTDEELGGAKKVLRAAALTYVASTLVAFASLLRLILLSRGRNDRRR
ncbi:MAG TPA: peptidase [Clostridiales bacterium]|nr:peptidase [Clostridiales bacterium]